MYSNKSVLSVQDKLCRYMAFIQKKYFPIEPIKGVINDEKRYYHYS